MLKPVHKCTYIRTYVCTAPKVLLCVNIVNYCSIAQGMMMAGIFYNCHKPLKYRNRLNNELPIRWLLFHSPQLQTHRKGQDEHIHTDEHRGHHAVYRCRCRCFQSLGQNLLEYHMPNHQGLERHQELILLLSLYLVIYVTVEFSL